MPIRRGDGTVINPKGYSEVRKGDGTILWSAESGPPAPVGTPYIWYPIDEGSGTLVADNVGTHDATNNGAAWTEDANRIGGWWLNGNGTSDYIETTQWGDFGAQMDTNFAIGFTFQTTESNRYQRFMRVMNAGDSMDMNLGLGSSNGLGDVRFQFHDAAGNEVTIQDSEAGWHDGLPHRVIFNKNGNTAADFSIWIDGVERNINVLADQGITTVSNFDVNVPILARNNAGTIEDFFNCHVDDVTVWKHSLSAQQLSDDYNRTG